METFPCYWSFVRWIHWLPVNSSHKCRWREALMFPFIYDWTNGRVNNRDAGDLRRHRAHYDVYVMVGVIYGCPIFKWVAKTWLCDRGTIVTVMVGGRHVPLLKFMDSSLSHLTVGHTLWSVRQLESVTNQRSCSGSRKLRDEPSGMRVPP